MSSKDEAMIASNGRDQTPSVVRRAAISAGLVFILLLLIWNTGRAGLGSLLTTDAAKTSNIAIANRAVSFNSNNPDAHYVRAMILEGLQDLPSAVAEFNQAAAARPDDFALWLSLARASELNGESDAAIMAARQAIPLAPYYAEPHWQLGNILLRSGRQDEAFKELGVAGVSNPMLMPGIIGLAGQMSNDNPEFVERALRPTSPEAYLALGQYFRQHQQVDAAIAMDAAAGSAAQAERVSYTRELIAAKKFKEAAVVWAIDHPKGVAAGVLLDPGFEEEGNLNEPGFAWRVGDNPQGFHFSLDPTNPREGRLSLRADFNGNSDPNSPIISQLVLVEPSTHYQLLFAIRSEEVVSGGLPRVIVVEADTTNVLGQSGEVPRATNGWREYTIDFESGPSANAIQIVLGRQNCDRPPCPIFGHLWLDNFALQKL